MIQAVAVPLPFPKPARFRPAGVVQWAAYSPIPPPFIHERPRRKGNRGLGQKYEDQAQTFFSEEFGSFYIPSPWFRFRASGSEKTRWCQPDGLIFQPVHLTITIVEIKLRHTADAWWQTQRLYLPVISNLFPPSLWAYNICEVVKWYDPAVAFPERHRLAASPLVLNPNEFGVHIYKP